MFEIMGLKSEETDEDWKLNRANCQSVFVAFPYYDMLSEIIDAIPRLYPRVELTDSNKMEILVLPVVIHPFRCSFRKLNFSVLSRTTGEICDIFD